MDAIVNVTKNWGIGLENKLLVSIPADLRRFRALTTGKTVILGRKTLETFPGGRPLNNRKNIIMSTNSDYAVAGARVVHDLPELFSLLEGYPMDDICLIGGAALYTQMLPYCRRVFLTRTLVEVPADRFFPDLDALPNWRVTHAGEVLEENGLRFQFVDYENTQPLPVGKV